MSADLEGAATPPMPAGSNTLPSSPPPPPGLGLRADRLTVRFGGVVALKSATFEIRSGERVGLVGPNGAGKSTLLNAISGLVRATGELIISTEDDAIDLLRRPPKDRARYGIGRTFQHSKLFRTMTVLEQLVAGGHVTAGYGVLGSLLRGPSAVASERALVDRARAVCVELGMTEYMTALTHELPGPHRRLVDVGRALMSRPRLLLLDEVAAGLTEAEKSALAAKLGEIATRRRMTMVVIEHDLDFVRTMTGRTLAMANGRIIADGETEAVLRDPGVMRVYVGEIA